jgi:predicted outer membrane repeat protein
MRFATAEDKEIGMPRKRFTVLIALIVLLTTFIAVVQAQNAAPQIQPNAAGLLPEFNRWRNAIGIHSYQEDIRLSASTQFHTDDMIARNHYEHTSPSAVDCFGSPVQEPHERAACFGTWDRGEGLTVGHTEPAAATRGWISSYGHCLGVMNPTATHMGGGHTTSTNPDFNEWDEAWAFQFNGVTDVSPALSEAFCGCTTGKNTEADIQACVVQINNQFNNGVAPTPAVLPLIERPLQRAFDRVFDNTARGGMCCVLAQPGTMSLRVVALTGNPTGVSFELGDEQFNRIGLTGTDSLTVDVTTKTSYSVHLDTTNLPAGDTFYFEVEQNTAGSDAVDALMASTSVSTGNDTTAGTVTASDDIMDSACLTSVADAAQLTAAIQRANDEAQCPGADGIFVTNDIQVTSAFDNGETAFPAITSHIVIVGNDNAGGTFGITRDASAPEFRFFLVDGTNGNRGNLELQTITLTGGRALDGGAVLVDARDGGSATLLLNNAHFVGNSSNGNGGAVATVSMNGGTVHTQIVNASTFSNNSAVYGGAFYNGGFDGGNAIAIIRTATTFTNNQAQGEGGAIYNNGLGANGHAEMLVDFSTFTENNAPRGTAIFNNGRAAGNAVLGLSLNTRFTAPASGVSHFVFINGAEGNAIVTTDVGLQFGGDSDVCIADGWASVACP